MKGNGMMVNSTDKENTSNRMAPLELEYGKVEKENVGLIQLIDII